MSFFSKCLKTNKILLERKSDNFKDIALDIKSLFTSHTKLKKKPLEYRISVINTIKENLIKNKNKIKLDLTQDMGKKPCQAQNEIDSTINYIDSYIKNIPKFLKTVPIHKKGYKIASNLESLGVVLKIVPFNFPIYLSLKMAIPNLLLGNTILIRPPEGCLKTGLNYELIFGNSEYIKNCFSGIKDTENILSMEEVVGVSFTGSTRVGRDIGGLAGKYLKRSVLELGGSDAFVVSDNCDLDYVVKLLFERRLANIGQICISPKRILVDEKVFREFKFKLMTEFEQFDEKDFPFLSSENLFKNLTSQVEKSIEYGDKILKGNLIKNKSNNKFYPFLIEPKDENSILMKEETFGPIFVIYPYKNEEEAIRITNNTKYGLGCSIFNKNLIEAENFSKLVDTGQVFINSFTQSNAVLPWGGIKESGYGRDCGQSGVEAFANYKTIITKL